MNFRVGEEKEVEGIRGPVCKVYVFVAIFGLVYDA